MLLLYICVSIYGEVPQKFRIFKAHLNVFIYVYTINVFDSSGVKQQFSHTLLKSEMLIHMIYTLLYKRSLLSN